jgi:glycosyltransferase involved in cell wall biosynthesis
MNRKASIVLCSYNMQRELPRTIRSLSPTMQRGVQESDYEIVVIDNGSTEPFSETDCRRWVTDLRVITIASPSPSPARAVNHGIAEAGSDLIGVLIDGARLVSPGIISTALQASKLCDRVVILTLGFHLGPKVQMESILEGYNKEQEDQLLAKSRWMEDGYRLFDISVFSGSSKNGWFSPMSESNAIFMRRELWKEMGGFDERFQTPGGGFVNLDTLLRAVQLPKVTVVTLLGEGTFHQVHGGVATNSSQDVIAVFHAEYKAIRGWIFQAPFYRSCYFGSVPDNALASIKSSAEMTSQRHAQKQP